MSPLFLILFLVGPFAHLLFVDNFRFLVDVGTLHVKESLRDSHKRAVSHSLRRKFTSKFADREMEVVLEADADPLQNTEPMSATITFAARPKDDGEFKIFLEARGLMSAPYTHGPQTFVNLVVLPKVLWLQLAISPKIAGIKLVQVYMDRPSVGRSDVEFRENRDIHFVRNKGYRVPSRQTLFHIEAKSTSGPAVKLELPLNSGVSLLTLKSTVEQKTGIAMAKQRIFVRDLKSKEYKSVPDNVFASDAVLDFIPLNESTPVDLYVKESDRPCLQQSYMLGKSLDAGLELYLRDDAHLRQAIAIFEIWATSRKPAAFTFLRFRGFVKDPEKSRDDPMKWFVSEAAVSPVKFCFILNLENTSRVSLFPPEAEYVNTGWIPSSK